MKTMLAGQVGPELRKLRRENRFLKTENDSLKRKVRVLEHNIKDLNDAIDRMSPDSETSAY